MMTKPTTISSVVSPRSLVLVSFLWSVVFIGSAAHVSGHKNPPNSNHVGRRRVGFDAVTNNNLNNSIKRRHDHDHHSMMNTRRRNYWVDKTHDVSSSSTTTIHPSPSEVVWLLRGGASCENCNELASSAYDWAINLGAPAALVAGAVVATIYENLRSGSLDIQKNDNVYTRFAKKTTSLLLYSSFALQMISIFVTTITGTMLLSKDFSNLESTANHLHTPLQFLHEHFEFEYLTSRLSFLQGLLNWLGGVALEHTIRRKEEGLAAYKMNTFVASATCTLILLLFSFYNAHLTFYKNYFDMWMTWIRITFQRFFLHYPPRPLAVLFIPCSLYTIYTLYDAYQVHLNDESTYE